MTEQLAIDFCRQVGRREFVLRKALEHREIFKPDFYDWLKSNLHVWERFDNEDRAWSAIFNMRARGQDTEMLTPYACAQCGLWHLGRLPSRLSPLAAYRAGVRS